jgi:hypothetical protein
MAIVINDFEAVAEAPPTQPSAARDGKESNDRGTAPAPEPHDIAPTLHWLAQHSLRSWAH